MSLNTWPRGTLQSAAWELGYWGDHLNLPLYTLYDLSAELRAAYYEGVIASSLAA
jgi:hypothetical protein